MIISALLGMWILAAVTQVYGRVSEPGDATTRNQTGRLRVLTGIIAYTDPRQGFVIIGSSVEDTHLARPGEHLPDGASIREIYPRHVVLEYGGRLETVGIYGRGEPTAADQVQIPSLPQPWSDKVDIEAATAGDALLSQAPRLTDEARNLTDEPRSLSDEPHSDPRLSDTPASETTGSERPSYDAQSTDAPQIQAEPQAPLPSAPDPADELSNGRRQRARR